MAAAAGQKGFINYLRRGMVEVPELVAALGFGAFGTLLIIPTIYIYYKTDYGNKRYKTDYTVYRPDDPRVKRIRTD